jgi:hypothetical protein
MPGSDSGIHHLHIADRWIAGTSPAITVQFSFKQWRARHEGIDAAISYREQGCFSNHWI